MRALPGGTFTADAAITPQQARTNNNNNANDTHSIPKKTPFVLFWSLATLLWSIFTPPHKTLPARTYLLQPLWLIRIFLRQDNSWTTDLLLFQTCHALYTYFVTKAWRLPAASTLLRILDLQNPDMRLYLQVFALLGVCGMFAGGIVFRGTKIKGLGRLDFGGEDGHGEGTSGSETGLQRQNTVIEDQVLPPLLIPSRTTHTRLFPKRHGFSYSYLLVGVPVGVQGRIDNVLSVDTGEKSPGAWFSVSAKDFLLRGERGGRPFSLAEKLKRYLHTQGVTDRDYAYAYLVTAPQFGGYSFNPVSFWYLYDSDVRLRYMILEVNNTFDERRIYLLKTEDGQNGSESDSPVEKGTERQVVFVEKWEKDFHVSPFNSRKGTYSLRATDPLAAYEETGAVQIDNTIVLRSSKEHTKIVARIRSEGAPKDPASINVLELTNFILAWWWVGFATFPRIVYEAGKLFFRRKLHVWYRPEVTDTSIGRTYTQEETVFEAFFKAFLSTAVSESTKPMRVIYEPAHTDTEIVLYSPSFTYEEAHQQTLTLKVLSPAFYSRFIHYTHLKEAFDRECLFTDEKNRTLSITRPELLPTLLEALETIPYPLSTTTTTTVPQSSRSSPPRPPRLPLLQALQWALLRRLRRPPPQQSYPPTSESTPSDPHMTLQDIRPHNTHLSTLDKFIQTHCSPKSSSPTPPPTSSLPSPSSAPTSPATPSTTRPTLSRLASSSFSTSQQPKLLIPSSTSSQDEDQNNKGGDAHIYLQTVLKLFLADRFALGVPFFLDLLDYALRVGFIVLFLVFASESMGAEGSGEWGWVGVVWGVVSSGFATIVGITEQGEERGLRMIDPLRLGKDWERGGWETWLRGLQWGEIWGTVLGLGLVNGVHVWGMLKG